MDVWRGVLAKGVMLLIIMFNIHGCAQTQKRQKVEFEGIHENKIRVLVQGQTTMEDPQCEGTDCRERIINSARERSTMLLRAMIMQRNPDNSEWGNTIQLKNGVHEPQIIVIKCGEMKCHALVDFIIDEDINTRLQKTDEGYHSHEGSPVKKDEK